MSSSRSVNQRSISRISSLCEICIRRAILRNPFVVARAGTRAVMSRACPWWGIIPRMKRTSASEWLNPPIASSSAVLKAWAVSTGAPGCIICVPVVRTGT